MKSHNFPGQVYPVCNLTLLKLARLIGDRLVSRGHTVTQVRYAGTNMKYDLDTNVTVMTLKIDDSRYPCPRYINRNGEFDIQNREMNLV